jgi:hypothetical protein
MPPTVDKPTKFDKGESYLSRPATSIPLQVSLAPEDARRFTELARMHGGKSRFFTAIFVEHLARRDERERLRKLLEESREG